VGVGEGGGWGWGRGAMGGAWVGRGAMGGARVGHGAAGGGPRKGGQLHDSRLARRLYPIRPRQAGASAIWTSA